MRNMTYRFLEYGYLVKSTSWSNDGVGEKRKKKKERFLCGRAGPPEMRAETRLLSPNLGESVVEMCNSGARKWAGLGCLCRCDIEQGPAQFWVRFFNIK